MVKGMKQKATSHTPGPWRMNSKFDDSLILISAHYGKNSILLHNVALVYYGPETAAKKRGEHNARLIRSAPEMFEASIAASLLFSECKCSHCVGCLGRIAMNKYDTPSEPTP